MNQISSPHQKSAKSIRMDEATSRYVRDLARSFRASDSEIIRACIRSVSSRQDSLEIVARYL